MGSVFENLQVALEVFIILDLFLALILLALFVFGVVSVMKLDESQRFNNIGCVIIVLILFNIVVDALGIAGAFKASLELILLFACLKLFCMGVVCLTCGW